VNNWRDIAAGALAKRAATSQAIASVACPELPTGVVEGVTSLPAERPRHVRAGQWRVIAEDARRLVHTGWAARAMALGWHELDLFGVSARGSEHFEGLAIWLAGRRIILITTEYCVAAIPEGRAWYNRGGFGTDLAAVSDVVTLWEFSRH